MSIGKAQESLGPRGFGNLSREVRVRLQCPEDTTHAYPDCYSKANDSTHGGYENCHSDGEKHLPMWWRISQDKDTEVQANRSSSQATEYKTNETCKDKGSFA